MKKNKKLGIRNIEGKELIRLLKKVTKRTFDHRDFVKSEHDWWTLYTLACMTSSVRDPRAAGILNMERSSSDYAIRNLVFKHFFQSDNGERSFWSLSRGQRQSMSYKCNRLAENLGNFVNEECFDRTRWYRHSDFEGQNRKKLKIERLYRVQIGGTPVAPVIALDEEHAKQLANMFILPMVPDDVKSDHDIRVHRVFELWADRKMEDFIAASTEISDNILRENTAHQERIAEIDKKIAANKLIINCLQSNLMVQLDVNE